MRHTTQTRTGEMLRRIAEELEQAEIGERHNAEFAAEQEARAKEQADERLDVRSIARSLRQIEEQLGLLVHHLIHSQVLKK